jgi:hypothetical protein
MFGIGSLCSGTLIVLSILQANSSTIPWFKLASI